VAEVTTARERVAYGGGCRVYHGYFLTFLGGRWPVWWGSRSVPIACLAVHKSGVGVGMEPAVENNNSQESLELLNITK